MSRVLSISESMLDILRASVKEKISEKRFGHTLGVEDMAKKMSEIYCPEYVNHMRAAALLHDVTKEYSYEEQLKILDKFGILVSEDLRLSPKTIHPITAAALIPGTYPDFNDEIIINAVRSHTTGRAGMSLTEKLIFLADLIEDGRKYDFCIQMRNLFWNKDFENMSERERLRHIDTVMLVTLNLSIKSYVDGGLYINGDTVRARNYILSEMEK